MSINPNPYVQAVDEVVIAQGPPRRHRALPTGVGLPNGDLLVGYVRAPTGSSMARYAACSSKT